MMLFVSCHAMIQPINSAVRLRGGRVWNSIEASYLFRRQRRLHRLPRNKFSTIPQVQDDEHRADRKAPFNSSGGSHAARTPTLRKSLGQHVLKDYGMIKKIVDKANVKSNEKVFELGPGTGNLTIHLLERAKKVYAVELDPAMCQATRERVEKL